MLPIFSKFRGLNNILPESERKIAFLTQADNVDITDTFGFRLRKGIVKRGTIAGHSLWSDDEICLYREGTSLKRFLPNESTITLRSDLSADPLPMFYLSLLGKVYYSDGRDKGIIKNGINRSWGLIVPPAPVASTITGTLLRGKYGIITTYIRNDGQESGASSITDVELADDAHAIRIFTEPSSDSSVSKIAIYVTTPNGTEFTFYTKVSNAINSVDITSMAFLGYPVATQYLSTIPAGVFLTIYNGRVFMVDNYVIWHSEPFSYELCKRSKNTISFDSPVNMLVAVDDGLWVGTDKQIMFLSGDVPPFKVAKVIPYGALNGSWVSEIPGEMLPGDEIKGQVAMFKSAQGICVAGAGGLFINLTENTFAFPSAISGHGLLRESNELNQLLIFLKDTAENVESYRNFVTEGYGILPALTGTGTM